MEEPARILVVEDDSRICDVLEYSIKGEGYDLRVTHRGREALEIVQSWSPAVVILDVGLPDLDGFEVCRQIRKTCDTPVLFLTSRSDEINRVVGLEIGGDDYIVKPFSARELLARIKVQLRRNAPRAVAPAPAGSPAECWSYGPIDGDLQRFRIRCHGVEVALTRQEFRLVELLTRAPGRVYTREQILDAGWPNGGMVTDRTIDAHVKTVRKKFGEFDFIETVRGIGYRAREL